MLHAQVPEGNARMCTALSYAPVQLKDIAADASLQPADKDTRIAELTIATKQQMQLLFMQVVCVCVCLCVLELTASTQGLFEILKQGIALVGKEVCVCVAVTLLTVRCRLTISSPLL